MEHYSVDEKGAVQTVDLDLRYNDIFEINGKWITFGDLRWTFTFHAKFITFVGFVHKVNPNDYPTRNYETSIVPPRRASDYDYGPSQTLMIYVDHPKMPKEIRIRSNDDNELEKSIRRTLEGSVLLSEILASKTKKERDAIRVLLDALEHHGVGE